MTRIISTPEYAASRRFVDLAASLRKAYLLSNQARRHKPGNCLVFCA